MKKLFYIFFGLGVIVLIFATWSLQKTKAPLLNQQQAVEDGNTEVSAPTSNPASQLESADSTKVENTPDKPKRLPSTKQTMQGILMERNTKPLDLYGRVVDQYGQPVAGAKVRGSIGLYVSMVQSGGELHYTETDSQGRFNFIGIHGAGIGIWPQKEGYSYNQRLLPGRPEDYNPDSSNPLTFVMWKLRGAETMKHAGFESRIPYDGTAASFDLQRGEKMANGGGDLRIALLRSPLQIAPGLLRPYDWQVKIELLNGGIIEESDPYPYWAAEAGYQPFFEASMSSNNVPWEGELRRNFYIKNAEGQYGLMLIELSTSSKRPDTGIKVETWINPSGSQNLEFDPAKQVQ